MKNSLDISEKIEKAVLYQDIAVFLEIHGQIEDAKFFMDKALEISHK